MESKIFMLKDKIRELEKANDEQTIHLFYDEGAGQYAAFGLSAYYTTIVTDPYAIYSEEIGLPMVRLTDEEVRELRKNMTIEAHEEKRYYKLRLRNKVGSRWYQTWADTVKKK